MGIQTADRKLAESARDSAKTPSRRHNFEDTKKITTSHARKPPTGPLLPLIRIMSLTGREKRLWISYPRSATRAGLAPVLRLGAAAEAA